MRVLSLILLASAAQAQIIRAPSVSSTPKAFVALGIGWSQQGGICDQPTNACWNFQGAPQWRASFDVPMGRGAALGVTGTMSRAEVDYDGGVFTTPAHANISQLLGTFRLGGGNELGFHQVIEVSAGAIFFTNFRDDSGTRLGASSTTDPAFSLGYGFGYGFGSKAEGFLVQDYGLVLHSHHMPGTSNSAQQSTTRIGLRLALGGR